MEELMDDEPLVVPCNNNDALDVNQLQSMVDYIPVGAMLIDNEGFIVNVNEEIEQTLGYSKEELKNNTVEHLLPKEFRGNHHSLMSQFFANPNKRRMGIGQELYALRKDGKKIPIEIGLNPINNRGLSWVLITLIDISPRIKANYMFQQSINAAPHGVLIINTDGVITLTNPSLCESFGYRKSELIGNKVEMLLPERYRKNHLGQRRSFNDNPSKRIMGIGRDLTALHKNGKEFPVEIGISPIEDGETTGMVLVTLTDITERKRMEMDLKETNTNLEEFTYVASHDLRSPLRGIADLLEWVKEDLEPDPAESITRNIDRIAIRIKRMEQLIDNLLRYARAGKAVTKTKDININQLFDDVLELVQPPSGFTLERRVDLKQLVCVATPLETILRNLISNAIKHHDREEGRILIKCKAENNMCHFSVSDDGPGIPESAMGRIFKLFQTVSSADRQGSGIGLSVSRRLAETHGGRVSVELNSPQKGVTFHVWWPRFIRTDTHD
mgnify:CR=1 FL=1